MVYDCFAFASNPSLSVAAETEVATVFTATNVIAAMTNLKILLIV